MTADELERNGSTSTLSALRPKLEKLESLISAHPDYDQSYATERTLMRFLVANEGNIAGAQAQLETTLSWRKSYQPGLPCKFCKEDPWAHNLRIVGTDVTGQPVLYTVFNGASLAHNGDSCVRHMCWVLEQAQDFLKLNGCVESQQWSIVVDFSGFGFKHLNPMTGVLCGRALAHYPERLKSLWLLDAPRIFSSTWIVIKQVLTERTKAKVRFVSIADSQPSWEKEGFSEEVRMWLKREMEVNRSSAYSIAGYWVPQPDHDPRGTKSLLATPGFRFQLDGLVSLD